MVTSGLVEARGAQGLGEKWITPLGTNYGVVYRACFRPRMRPSEEALYLRFAVIGSGHRDDVSDYEDGWMLVTTEGVRWHLASDRVPGMPPRDPMEKLLGALIREVLFRTPGLKVGASDTYPGPGGTPARGLLLKDERDERSLVFVIAADPSTDALITDVMRRSAAE
jgi:hypothetical protein